MPRSPRVEICLVPLEDLCILHVCIQVLNFAVHTILHRYSTSSG